VIIILNLYITNSENNNIYKDISYNIKNNKLTFNIENDKYIVERKDNIHIKKENSESILDFIYINNKETTGTYYIKEMNFYMDAKVKTKKLINEDKMITIKYELYLQDEFIDNFELKIEIKE